MKRVISVALAAALSAGLALPAAAAQLGEVVDYALHTDIVAQINGHALRSYNVGGRTAIAVADLAGYGFQVYWDSAQRTVKVERTMNEQGEPVNPNAYPGYEPDALQAPVGSRAEAIYATDIKTYVAGKQVEAFNAGGRTLIWLSELSCYGQVIWDAEQKLSKLVLGDPMQSSLAQVIQSMRDWAGDDMEYQLYPGEHGTLVVGYNDDSAYGIGCRMEYVNLAGNRMNINAILPTQGVGVEYYLRPRSIVLQEDQLYFTTTMSGENAQRIAIDLTLGKLVASSPARDAITNWSITTELNEGEMPDGMERLELVVAKKPGEDEVEIISQVIPFEHISAKVTNSGVTVYINQSSMTNMGDGLFATACRRLYRSAIPSVFRDYENFNRHNSQGQRDIAAKYFKVTYNSSRVTGDLFWAGKSTKRELRFDFDYKLALKEGDTLTIWMGVEA